MVSQKRLLATALPLIAVGVCVFNLQRSPDSVAVSRTHHADGFADELTCVDCHEQAETFWQTGHPQTLHRVVGDDSQSLLLQHWPDGHPSPADFISLHAAPDGVDVRDTQSGGANAEVTLQWRFGSGRHASTWVAPLSDSWGGTDLLEFRWTWYHEQQQFDVTPGQPREPGIGHLSSLGLLFDHSKARRCFACHSTYLPIHDGRIDEEHIMPGVTCQRCHGPLGGHVASGGSLPPESLATLDPVESILRCAECHRRADEQPPDSVRPDNPDLARFQPAGLMQSACFKRSPGLSCLTCHDPHLPLEAQNSRGLWQCLQCHDADRDTHVTCAAGHRDDCLSCHMPRVRGSAPVSFTDHWIRVRDDIENSTEGSP